MEVEIADGKSEREISATRETESAAQEDHGLHLLVSQTNCD
jgi:hypothetical protein